MRALGLGGLGAGAAGLGAGLRVAQPLYVSLTDQVLTAWTARRNVPMFDPATDRHVAHTELGGSFLDGQQLFLFHPADRTAFCEQHNTLRAYTGSHQNLYNSSTDYLARRAS